MGIHVGDLVAVRDFDQFGVIVGRCPDGWIVDVGHTDYWVTPHAWKVIVA